MMEGAFPEPILPERPALTRLYYAAMEAAAGPPPELTLLWDAAFAPFWGRYATGGNAGAPLDEFYRAQRSDGAIPLALAEGRAIYHDDKAGMRELAATGRPAALCPPPPLAWPEWLLYQAGGDGARLLEVLETLGRQMDWETSEFSEPKGAMRWTPPAPHPWHHRDAIGWVEYTAMIAVNSEHLSQIAHCADRKEIADACAANFLALKEMASERLWDDLKKGYLDIDDGDIPLGPLSASSFWALMANFPNNDQIDHLLMHLKTPRTFGRSASIPAISAQEKEFRSSGDAFTGGAWTPSIVTIASALWRCQQYAMASAIALRHLETMSAGLETHGKIWESYSSDVVGEPAAGAIQAPPIAAPLGPAALLFEFVIGADADGDLAELHYRPSLEETHGVKNFPVGDALVSFTSYWEKNQWRIEAETDAPADLVIHGASGVKELTLKPGAIARGAVV